MSTPIRKQGDLLSETYLAWVRTLDCAVCMAWAPSQPHHWPPKGRVGCTDDTRTMPVCVRCHRRCHGEKVDGLAPIGTHEQTDAVNRTQIRFFLSASAEQWRQVGEDRAKHFESRIW